MTLKLDDIRQEYSKKELSPEDCANNPITQFEVWLKEAIDAKVNEPTAMNVATVNAQGRPEARIVLLKGVEDQKLVFYTNYNSQKGKSIEQNPFIAITFFWPELERQVRLEGTLVKVDTFTSDTYFASRPYTSKLGAWASEQSQVIDNKNILIKRAAMFGLKYPLNVPRPNHWGGYAFSPDKVEFWQGRPSRLHDRIVYTLNEHLKWDKVRLAP